MSRPSIRTGTTRARPTCGPLDLSLPVPKMRRISVGLTINLIAFATIGVLAVQHAGAASPNSCANVDVLGSFDDVSIHESDYGINVAGTFRIAGEPDENRQPMFNLTNI